MRERLASELGGLRGSLETALPLVVFTVIYVVGDDIPVASGGAVGTALVAFAVRWWQGSTLRFVGNGLFGIVVAAGLASLTGQAEAAFLPGILQSGAWSLLLGGSIAARRPLAGYLIGAVLGDPTGWRASRPVVRLADRLTFILLVPMLIRVAVQLPLYLAEEVGWLGVSRVALGWPLYAIALAAAGTLLLRGETPIEDRRVDPPSDD